MTTVPIALKFVGCSIDPGFGLKKKDRTSFERCGVGGGLRDPGPQPVRIFLEDVASVWNICRYHLH